MSYRHAASLFLTAMLLLISGANAWGGSTEQVTLRVEGMTCPGCEATVESVLSGVEGVMAAEADRRTQTAVSTYDPQRTSPEQLVEVINSETYYLASLPVTHVDQAMGNAQQPATTAAESSEQGPGNGYAMWALAGLSLAVAVGVLARARHSS